MVAFRCYNPSGGKDRGFHAWCDELSPEFRSAVDVELELAGRDKTLEESGRFKALRGKCLGLTEILIDFEVELNPPPLCPDDLERGRLDDLAAADRQGRLHAVGAGELFEMSAGKIDDDGFTRKARKFERKLATIHSERVLRCLVCYQ